MRITERLNVEHGIFLRQLGYLDSLLRDGNAPLEAIGAVVRTIAGTISAHCRVEDRFLLATIEDAFGSDGPALGGLKGEHEEIEAMLVAAFAGPVDTEFARRFASKLRVHIEKEIHFLMPLAEQWLSPERLTTANNWNEDHIYEHTCSLKGAAAGVEADRR